MTKTVQAALSPLFITASFCCLSFFEYPLGRVRLYLSCFYFLIAGSLYAYVFYSVLSTTDIPLAFISWNNIIVTVASIISILVSLFHFQGLRMCLRKLSIVDDTLERLGTPKEYRRLRNWMIRVIIGWIVVVFLTNMLDFLSWGYSKDHFEIKRFVVIFVANHLFHVNNINALKWGTILGYTSSRFQRINEHIHNLLENDCTEERKASVPIDQHRKETTECRQRIWIIMHVHLQLSCISRELNKVFSMQITLEMACLFTFLVELFLDFYNLYSDDSVNAFFQVLESLVIYLWAVIFIVKLLAVNYVCQIVCDKANETTATLYKLSNDTRDENLREQILQFTLQIKQRQVKFSGMGLFYFGHSFVRKFFMSIMTVVVIIVQMRTSHHSDHAFTDEED